MRTIDYSRLPEHMQESMRLYIEERMPPGGFLSAILANDLHQAAARADHINRARLFDYVAFLENEVPRACWGSREAVAQWLKKREEP